MKRWFPYATALVCCALVLGCGKESGKGGPGAKPAANDAKDGHEGDDVQNEDNTFTITVPSAMTITQGESEKMAVAVNRGDQFKQTVKIAVDAPAGVEVTPKTMEAGAEQDEVELDVTIADSATVGEHTITVKGTPEEGEDVSQSFKLTIEERTTDDDGN